MVGRTSSIIAGLFLSFLSLSLVSLTPPVTAAGAVTIVPGVPVNLPSGFANLTFDANQTFANVSLPDGHTVCFDTPSRCLSVEKYPASYPSVLLNFAQWTPGASYGVVAQWTLSVQIPPAGTPTSVWINFTGLGGVTYMEYAGPQLLAQQAGPAVSIALSPYSLPANPMFLTIGTSGGGGGGGGGGGSPAPMPFACSQSMGFFFTTSVTCSLSAPLPNDTVYAWSVNGTQVCAAAVCTFPVRDLGIRSYLFIVRLVATSASSPLSNLDETQPIVVTTNVVSGVSWGFVAVLAMTVVLLLRGAKFPSPHNPEYRETASKVAFYPDNSDNPGWVSYRQLEPRFPKYVSKHRRAGDHSVWVVYGIRNGKARIQAIREPVDVAPRRYVLGALARVRSSSRRERIEDNLRRRGVL